MLIMQNYLQLYALYTSCVPWNMCIPIVVCMYKRYLDFFIDKTYEKYSFKK